MDDEEAITQRSRRIDGRGRSNGRTRTAERTNWIFEHDWERVSWFWQLFWKIIADHSCSHSIKVTQKQINIWQTFQYCYCWSIDRDSFSLSSSLPSSLPSSVSIEMDEWVEAREECTWERWSDNKKSSVLNNSASCHHFNFYYLTSWKVVLKRIETHS